MRIAVLGGGNGSFAAAGDLALAGHDIRLWRRDREAAAAHRAAGGLIVVKDFRGSHEAKPALITDDIAAALRDAELILCPAPAPAQSDIARLLAPHLVAGQVVFLSPGTFGTFVFAKAAQAAGNRAEIPFAETGTLPWLTRKHGPFEVAITIRAKRLPTGVFPLRLRDHALAVIGAAFPGAIEPEPVLPNPRPRRWPCACHSAPHPLPSPQARRRRTPSGPVRAPRRAYDFSENLRHDSLADVSAF